MAEFKATIIGIIRVDEDGAGGEVTADMVQEAVYEAFENTDIDVDVDVVNDDGDDDTETITSAFTIDDLKVIETMTDY